MLRFGHPEDKADAVAYQRRSQQRQRIAENVVAYYCRYVVPEDWPTESAPHCFYPKSFDKVPLSTLQEAARRLQAIRAASSIPPPESRP